MTTYQWRRFICLWTPIYVTGIGMIAVAAHLTSHINGLTVLGTLVALGGLMAAARDTKERS